LGGWGRGLCDDETGEGGGGREGVDWRVGRGMDVEMGNDHPEISDGPKSG